MIIQQILSQVLIVLPSHSMKEGGTLTLNYFQYLQWCSREDDSLPK